MHSRRPIILVLVVEGGRAGRVAWALQFLIFPFVPKSFPLCSHKVLNICSPTHAQPHFLTNALANAMLLSLT